MDYLPRTAGDDCLIGLRWIYDRRTLDEELKRRTLVVRIFPNADRCLRLVRALPTEIHKDWIEAMRYHNTEQLTE